MKLESVKTIEKTSRSMKRNATRVTSTNEKVEGIEKIDLSDFEIKEKIGKDSYGIYKICKNKLTGKVYTMLIVKKADNLQNKAIEHLSNEYKILSSIYHPFIIELKGINHTDPYTLTFLLEFVPGGDLNSFMRNNNKMITLEQSKFYLASIITALDYLHKKKIIYRDLKPENVLINSNGYIKLFNFGFAKIMKTDVTYTLCGTPEYCSPEMINKSGHSKTVDFWGLGILLYEMLVGFTPFMDPDPMKIYAKINKGKVSFPININKHARTLIKHFLIVDVHKRLGCSKKGFVDIIEHEFFQGFDWKSLLFKTLEAPFIPVTNGPMDPSNFPKYEDSYMDDAETPVSKNIDPFYNW